MIVTILDRDKNNQSMIFFFKNNFTKILIIFVRIFCYFLRTENVKL